MGSLTLPASGTAYVETPALISTVERHSVYGPLLDPFWQAASTGQFAPNALHTATALVTGCDFFITNDIGFRRVPGLLLAILDAVLASGTNN